MARLALWGGIGGALLPFLGVVILALSGGVVLGIQINVLALLGVIAISGAFGASFAGIQARAARQLPSGVTRPLSKGEIG